MALTPDKELDDWWATHGGTDERWGIASCISYYDENIRKTHCDNCQLPFTAFDEDYKKRSGLCQHCWDADFWESEAG